MGPRRFAGQLTAKSQRPLRHWVPQCILQSGDYPMVIWCIVDPLFLFGLWVVVWVWVFCFCFLFLCWLVVFCFVFVVVVLGVVVVVSGGFAVCFVFLFVYCLCVLLFGCFALLCFGW